MKRPFAPMRYREFKSSDDFNALKGWFMSEKNDGWFTTIHGSSGARSKSGKRTFRVPFHIGDDVGPPLVAELVIEGRRAPAVASLLNPRSALWARAYFEVFDVMTSQPFSTRIRQVKKRVSRVCARAPRPCRLRVVPQTRVRSGAHVARELKRVVAAGGEGLVVTKASNRYKKRSRSRSRTRFKIKSRRDAEGVVVGRVLRADNSLKSLRLRAHGRHRASFNLGSGFTTMQRRRHRTLFPVGTVVTFSYRNRTRHGKPTETRFLRQRNLFE